MLTAIDFVSLAVFERIAPATDMAAISIGDPAQLPPANLEAFQLALRLEFLDIEPSDSWAPTEALFSQAQLAELIHFVRRLHHSQDNYRLVVHCRLGMSRSAAVALIAHHLAPCEFPRYPASHYANRYVLHLAEKVFRKPIQIPPVPSLEAPADYIPQQLQI